MKKFIYITLFAVAMSFGVTACDEEIDTTEGIFSATPAADAAGTYSGTWTNESPTGTTEESGTITLSVVEDSPYMCNLSVVAGSYTATGNANIVSTVNGFKIYNMQEGMCLGTKTVYGEIVDGEFTIGFTKVNFDGPHSTQSIYSFIGTK